MKDLLKRIDEKYLDWYVVLQPSGAVYVMKKMPEFREDGWFPIAWDLDAWANMWTIGEGFTHLWCGQNWENEPKTIREILNEVEMVEVLVLEAVVVGNFEYETPKRFVIPKFKAADPYEVAIELSDLIHTDTADWVEVIVEFLRYEVEGEEYRYELEW